MEFKSLDAKYKLAFGRRKIYVYNVKTGEQVDTIYCDEKIKDECQFKSECYGWQGENYMDMIGYENME